MAGGHDGGYLLVIKPCIVLRSYSVYLLIIEGGQGFPIPRACGYILHLFGSDSLISWGVGGTFLCVASLC